MVGPRRPVPEARFREPRYRDADPYDLGVEDQLSAFLVAHPEYAPDDLTRPFRSVPVGEGPELDDQTEHEYKREKNT
ncbi:hypothetical protein ACFYY8_31190 [Streptosporangium sp. NPDC001559]|uniref:hypothetical protein n=1 Tax=Streptosporangium sp. NPDC001559 TaxID=3366187 RepID=UPI0036F1825C